MCSRYLGFILLVWFPGALHAQSAAQPCPAPSLDGGYFFPVKETYSHDSKLTYACRNTRKPAVQGWWAESVCQNGVWSHTPRCIEEKACILPTISNAKYTEASEGWHKEGHTIRITCDKGYEHKDNIATARCRDGTWSSLPSCEISIKSCPVPPKDPHAVIIDQGYQEMFPEDAGVKYECEVGYSIEGSPNYTLFCLAGTWSEGPMCRSSSTSANTPLFIPIEHCGTRPIVPNGVVVEEERMYLKFQCQAFYKQVGEETVRCYNGGSWSKVPVCEDAFCVMEPGYYVPGLEVPLAMYIKEGETEYIPCTRQDHSVAVHCSNRRITHTGCKDTGRGGGHGGSAEAGTSRGHSTSSGRGTQPGRGGSSSTSANTPLFIPIESCGIRPSISNGDIVETREMFLKYACNSYYKYVGPETVVCHSNGTWSDLPSCKATFCSVDTREYPKLHPDGVKYVKDGENVSMACVDDWRTDHFSVVRCTEGIIRLSKCCSWISIKLNACSDTLMKRRMFTD